MFEIQAINSPANVSTSADWGEAVVGMGPSVFINTCQFTFWTIGSAVS